MKDIIEQNLKTFYLSFSKFNKNITAIRNATITGVFTPCYPWPNYLLDLSLNRPDIQEVVIYMNKKIEEGKYPPFIIVQDSRQHPDFLAIMEKYRFRPVVQWSGMAAPAQQNQNELYGQPVDCKVKPVQSETELNDWLNIANTALFNQKKLHPDVFRFLPGSDNYDLLLGYADNKPAGTGLVFRNHNSTGIYLVSVLEKFRRRGIASVLTSYMIKLSSGLPLVLHATPTGKKVYERFHFQEYCTFEVFWKIGKFV